MVLWPAPAIPRTAPRLRRSRQVLQVAYGRPVRARAKAAPGVFHGIWYRNAVKSPGDLLELVV